MRRVYVVAVVCAALAAAASGAGAQSVSSKVTSADKASPSVRLTSARSAAKDRVRKLREIERRGIQAARRAKELAGRHPMSQANVEKYAVQAEHELQDVMGQLESAWGHSQHSSHLAELRSHQQQAVTAASALKAAASARQPGANTISADADAVIQHAQAALDLMTSPTATDDWIVP